MLPSYQAFLSGDNLVAFWNDVKWLLFLVAPGLLIWVSIDAVTKLIEVIKGAFPSKKRNQKEKEADEYDMYRY